MVRLFLVVWATIFFAQIWLLGSEAMATQASTHRENGQVPVLRGKLHEAFKDPGALAELNSHLRETWSMSRRPVPASSAGAIDSRLSQRLGVVRGNSRPASLWRCISGPPFRQTLATAKGQGTLKGLSQAPPVVGSALAIIVLREHLPPEYQEQVAEFLARHRDVSIAYHLSQRFRRTLAQRDGADLNYSLGMAQDSGLPAFRRFAGTISLLWDAVHSGIVLRWSTGPLEAKTPRLKMLKRLGHGRSSMAFPWARLGGTA